MKSRSMKPKINKINIMKYLMKFDTHSDYQDYKDGEVWLPRVSFIINGGEAPTSEDKYSDDGPSYVDFARIGTKFVEVANGGTMYFTNQVIDGVQYSADVVGDSLEIKSIDLSTGQFTDDVYVDEENGQIVINCPDGSESYSL